MTVTKKKAGKRKNVSKKCIPSEVKLTAKQELFVQEYLVDLNSCGAAIRAGYSKKAAKQMGSENLSKPYIAKAIKEAKDKRCVKVGIDASIVLDNLVAMVNADPCDIIDKDTGVFMPIHDWPLTWRKMLSAIDVKEIMEYQDSGDSVKIGSMVKFKFPDRLRVIEVLGKHVDVQAFLRRVEVNDSSSLVDRLERARKRAGRR